MLRIWGRTNSINVQKVLWCCAELGLTYERVDAGGQFGVVDTAEYRALNPNGLVPTIDDSGFILWESNVIVRYLAERHGEGTLRPKDIKARYTAEKWMEWQATTLWPALKVAFMGLVRTAPEKRDQAAIQASLTETATALAGLERQLEASAFVAGDNLSMGDIPLGGTLYRCFNLGVERDRFPNVARWYDRLTERDAFRTHVMLPLT